VAGNPSQTHGLTQWQCSCLPASITQSNLLKMNAQLNRSGLASGVNRQIPLPAHQTANQNGQSRYRAK
jgi:hypothetical protein